MRLGEDAEGALETECNRAVMELKQMRDLLRTGEKKEEPGGHLTGEITPLFDRVEFCSMVEKAKHQSVREISSRSCFPTVSRPPLREAF